MPTEESPVYNNVPERVHTYRNARAYKSQNHPVSSLSQLKSCSYDDCNDRQHVFQSVVSVY